jgi:hypothetical protein
MQNLNKQITFVPLDTAVNEKKLPVILTTATISLQNITNASYSAALICWHIFRLSRTQ